jgi:hypothetical protein
MNFNINFDLEFSKMSTDQIKQKLANDKNSINPLTKILVK